MELIDFSIFQEENLKEKGLEKNQENYNIIYNKYREEIIEIKDKFSREAIEVSINSSYPEELIEIVTNNLFHLLDSVEFIEGKGEDGKAVTIAAGDCENIKELTIGKLLDLNFEINEGVLNIDIAELLEKIEREKREDIWEESVVENTLCSKYLIEKKENVKLINSLSDYTQFVYELESRMSNSLVSRGQKDCSYSLTPSIYRIHKKRQDVHAKGYEHTFRQRMAHYTKDTRERSNEELRAEGQHYGLPTEYLDFTEAHIISLLFAIEEYSYKDNHSIVFFIDSTSFNKITVNKEEKLINLQQESEKAYLKDYTSCSYFIKLPNINERIHFQKGCFLRISPQDYTDNTDFLENLKDNLGIAIINKDFKEEILKELFSLGITFESIYPDKDNLVKSIRFSYEIMQGGGGSR